MPSSRGKQLLILAAVLLAAAPAIFGLIRFLGTGDDVRYLWLAGSAMLGSLAVMVLGYDASGATAGLGVAIVALGFGLCTGTSAVLGSIALHLVAPRAKRGS